MFYSTSFDKSFIFQTIYVILIFPFIQRNPEEKNDLHSHKNFRQYLFEHW